MCIRDRYTPDFCQINWLTFVAVISVDRYHHRRRPSSQHAVWLLFDCSDSHFPDTLAIWYLQRVHIHSGLIRGPLHHWVLTIQESMSTVIIYSAAISI